MSNQDNDTLDRNVLAFIQQSERVGNYPRFADMRHLVAHLPPAEQEGKLDKCLQRLRKAGKIFVQNQRWRARTTDDVSQPSA